MDIRPNIYLVEGHGNLKAVADVNLGNEFAVKGLKVVDGPKGLFVAMPTKKVGDNYEETFHPITKESREQLIASILEAYEQKLTRSEVHKNEDSTKKGNKKSEANQPSKKGNEKGEIAKGDTSEMSGDVIGEQEEEGPVMQM